MINFLLRECALEMTFGKIAGWLYYVPERREPKILVFHSFREFKPRDTISQHNLFQGIILGKLLSILSAYVEAWHKINAGQANV